MFALNGQIELEYATHVDPKEVTGKNLITGQRMSLGRYLERIRTREKRLQNLNCQNNKDILDSTCSVNRSLSQKIYSTKIGNSIVLKIVRVEKSHQILKHSNKLVQSVLTLLMMDEALQEKLEKSFINVRLTTHICDSQYFSGKMEQVQNVWEFIANDVADVSVPTLCLDLNLTSNEISQIIDISIETHPSSHTCILCNARMKAIINDSDSSEQIAAVSDKNLLHLDDTSGGVKCLRKNKFTCAICNEQFSRHSNLLRHSLVHESSNGRFLCKYCGCSYKFASTLTRHLVKNHRLIIK